MANIRIIVMMSITLLLVSCGDYLDVKKTPQDPNINKTSTEIDFATVKSLVLQNNCINCHKGQHVAYNSYAFVKADINKILKRIEAPAGAGQMPPEQRLPASSIQLIKDWAAAGAPEFVGNNVPTEEKPTTLNFSRIRDEILTPRCVQCHSHFNDYNVVRRNASNIVSLVMSNKMPFKKRERDKKNKPLTDYQKDLLQQWADEGFPLVAGEAIPEVPTPELKPTWLSLRNNVFGPKCMICHNTFGSRAGGSPLETYTQVQKSFAKNPALFNFESPEQSEFIDAILAREGTLFENPMPYNNDDDDIENDVPPLTDSEVEMIIQWIRLKLPYK